MSNGIYKFNLNGQEIEVSIEDLKNMIDEVIKYENQSTFGQQKMDLK